MRPQQAVSKVVPKPVPLKNKLNIFEPCEVFVNLTLMNRASVIYSSGGKSSVIPALGLQYTGLHCFEKAKTNYDMVCIYEMEANTDPNRTVGGPYEPIFQDGYKLQSYDYPIITIPPKENMLLVFPSWVPHAVETNLSDEDRISLSFNFILNRSLP